MIVPQDPGAPNFIEERADRDPRHLRRFSEGCPVMPKGFDRLCDPFRDHSTPDDVSKHLRPRPSGSDGELVEGCNDVVGQPPRYCFAHAYAIVCKRISGFRGFGSSHDIFLA